jgi:hypothetical protein
MRRRLASWCPDQLGITEGRASSHRAAQLATRFGDAFWCEEIGT